ncbi:hypothetical protein pb186bvf_021186 [Paramecium bursaria]
MLLKQDGFVCQRLRKIPTIVEKNSHRFKSHRTTTSFSQRDTSTRQPVKTSCEDNDRSHSKPSSRVSNRLNFTHSNFHPTEIDYQFLEQLEQKEEQPLVLKSKLSQEFVVQGGRKIPVKIYLRNWMLKSYIEESKLVRESVSSEKMKEDMHKRLQPEKERLMSNVFQIEKSKRIKEFRSRSAYDNAYFNILALNKKSRKNLQQKLKRILPIESRFQLQKFDFTVLDNLMI